MNDDQKFMKQAMKLAQKARDLDEVPVGAVVVHDGKVIGRGWNVRQTKQNPLLHAEMMAIEKASKKLGSWRLDDCTLYVTLEPCPMCAGAIIQSRIPRVVFGAYDPKGGSVCTCTSLFDIPQYNHHPVYTGGVLEEECSAILTDFFRKKREAAKARKKAARQEQSGE